MLKRIAATAACLVFVSSTALADLEPWQDYEVSDAVWSVTTVKVDSNMGDAYLEGIRETWAASNDIAVKLGHIESYSIFRSVLPESGDFNLMLVVKFADTADLAPNKARYEAFMREVGKAKSDERTQYAQKNYPGMRKLTGEYWVREITFK